MRAAVDQGLQPSTTVENRNRATGWCHIILGEGAQAGGMCAHMTLLADGLAEESEKVHVWLPDATELKVHSPRVEMHGVLGSLSMRDFLRAGRALNRCPAPRRLLVYWVPHAFGHKAMNLPFCFWIWLRSAWHKDRVELMVQECFLEFTKNSWRQTVAAFVQRVMTIVLLAAADHVWGALSDYGTQLRPLMLGRRVPFGWLPVPSNIAVANDPAAVAAIRKEFASARLLLGHFGTFGKSITDPLQEIVPALLRNLDCNLLLLGSGSEAFRDRLRERHPDLSERVHATGFLNDLRLSSHLSACDVMIQPYPEGVTARRGSMLAPLAHGRPVVTNPGFRTESLWKESGAVVLAPLTASGFLEALLQLRDDPGQIERVRTAARETYLRYFEPSRMIQAIQHGEANSCAC
jgi:glycosyltransferase involved in cell wall biosynthesis